MAAALAVAGCSGVGTPSGASPATPSPATPTPATPSPAGPSPATPSAAPSRARLPQEPLVLAVHPTRPPVRITAATARRVLAGRVRDWRSLGAAPGPLRVARGPAAIAVVERDPRVLAVGPASAVGPSVHAVVVDGRDPLRDPGRYPLRVPGPAPGPVVTLSVVGDVMLGRRVGQRLAARGDWAAALRPAARRLAAADVTVGTLESTLSRAGAPRQGDDSFAADPRALRGLAVAGFDVLTLANNHVGDFGPRATVQTLARAAAAGFRTVGAGVDGASARRAAVVERDGVRIGFLAFNAIGETPRAGPRRPGVVEVRMPPRTGPLDAGDLRAVQRDVRALGRRVDAVVVLPHWGQQYTHDAVPAQRRVGRALVDAGADLVLGSHPHWVQGAEVYRGRLVAWSLGNFVFDMDFSRRTQEGVVAEVTLWGGAVKAVRFAPVRIGADFAPRFTGGREAAAVLGRMWRASGAPFSAGG